MKRNAEALVRMAIRDCGVTPASDPCMVTMVFHEPNRRRDADNVEFARKFVLDALAAQGVIAGDSPRHLLAAVPMTEYGGAACVEVDVISGEPAELRACLDELKDWMSGGNG